jgi:hypothetical protein
MPQAFADRQPGNESPHTVYPDIDGPNGIGLLVPATDVTDPEGTSLIPALDEEPTIGQFIDWCHEGLRDAGARVEILSTETLRYAVLI